MKVDKKGFVFNGADNRHYWCAAETDGTVFFAYWDTSLEAWTFLRKPDQFDITAAYQNKISPKAAEAYHRKNEAFCRQFE